MAFSDTLLNINDAGSNVNINITKAFPLTGKINDTIVISGQNFFGISSVTFGGGVTGTFSAVDKKSILLADENLDLTTVKLQEFFSY